MIAEIIKDNSMEARALIGFYGANAVGDDIALYQADEEQKEEVHLELPNPTLVQKSTSSFFHFPYYSTPQPSLPPLWHFRVQVMKLHGLRQQAEKEDPDMKYYSISDFIFPESSGVRDYVGMFVSSVFGVDALEEKYKKDHDDYSIILVKALADRFAEALAEKIHEEIRRQHWGYSKDETLEASDLHKVNFLASPKPTHNIFCGALLSFACKFPICLSNPLAQIKYQGIRPAPGYPSQPDHTEKAAMWELMKVSYDANHSLLALR